MADYGCSKKAWSCALAIQQAHLFSKKARKAVWSLHNLCRSS